MSHQIYRYLNNLPTKAELLTVDGRPHVRITRCGRSALHSVITSQEDDSRVYAVPSHDGLAVNFGVLVSPKRDPIISSGIAEVRISNTHEAPPLATLFVNDEAALILGGMRIDRSFERAWQFTDELILDQPPAYAIYPDAAYA